MGVGQGMALTGPGNDPVPQDPDGTLRGGGWAFCPVRAHEGCVPWKNSDCFLHLIPHPPACSQPCRNLYDFGMFCPATLCFGAFQQQDQPPVLLPHGLNSTLPSNYVPQGGQHIEYRNVVPSLLVLKPASSA